MCCNYEYRQRKDCDPKWINPKINQDEYERERIETVVKDRMMKFLRLDSANSVIFENEQAIKAMLNFGISVFDDYKEIKKEINK